jgi:hypothetical protein
LHCKRHIQVSRRRPEPIIDPTTMIEMMIRLERTRIVSYVKHALRNQIEDAQARADDASEELRAEIEDLRGELDDVNDDHDEYDA